MGDDLGVRLARELVAAGLQLLAQLTEVLHDAVVDDGHAARAVQVRVRVAVRGGAVRGPARVGNAAGGAKVALGALLDELGHATGALHAAQATVIAQDLDAGGIVSAILKRLEAVEQKGRGLGSTREGNDSAQVGLLS